MTIKSLLAAVSMVAITAGSANALILTNNTVGGAVTPALELQTPLSPGSAFGDFTFSVAPNVSNQFSGGQNLVITVTLPAGIEFTSQVTGADVFNAISSATVQNGSGGAGTSTVQFLGSVFASAAFNQPIDFNLPLSVADCPTGNIIVTVATETGTPIEEGTITSSTTAGNTLFNSCASAIDGVVTSDEAASDTTITIASNYTALIEIDALGAPIAAVNTLGFINYTIDPTVAIARAAPTGPIQPLAAADIDELSFSVVFEDAAAMTIMNLKTDAGSNILGTKNGNQFDFSVTNAALIAELVNGVADEFIVTVDGVTTIVTQNVVVANSVVSFRDTGTPDLIVSEAGAAGSLDPLQREGRDFGFFDWNAGQAIPTPTESVYRITGLDPSAPVDYTLTIENSNADGTYSGVVTANAEGEAVLFATTMPIPATVRRFDVLINVETPNLDVDIDRLMERGGVITSFNDGANNDQEDRIEPNLNDTDN